MLWFPGYPVTSCERDDGTRCKSDATGVSCDQVALIRRLQGVAFPVHDQACSCADMGWLASTCVSLLYQQCWWTLGWQKIWGINKGGTRIPIHFPYYSDITLLIWEAHGELVGTVPTMRVSEMLKCVSVAWPPQTTRFFLARYVLHSSCIVLCVLFIQSVGACLFTWSLAVVSFASFVSLISQLYYILFVGWFVWFVGCLARLFVVSLVQLFVAGLVRELDYLRFCLFLGGLVWFLCVLVCLFNDFDYSYRFAGLELCRRINAVTTRRYNSALVSRRTAPALAEWLLITLVMVVGRS